MNKRGKTFIISGPSGVGKSTVLHALFAGRDDLYFSVSATTRAPREGERDGVDYHFIHADRFREMIEGDAFLEYAEYVGNFYGTPKKYVDEAMEQGKDVILDIEVQGAIQVTSKRPDAVRIFIAPFLRVHRDDTLILPLEAHAGRFVGGQQELAERAGHGRRHRIEAVYGKIVGSGQALAVPPVRMDVVDRKRALRQLANRRLQAPAVPHIKAR